MTGYGRGRNRRGQHGYLIKTRTREIHQHAIAGGTKRGGGTRNVARWTPWRMMATAHTAVDAISTFERVKAISPLREIAVFHKRKRVEIETLRDRADDERRERGTLVECNACMRRRRAGFEGQCPACANERASAELAAERARG